MRVRFRVRVRAATGYGLHSGCDRDGVRVVVVGFRVRFRFGAVRVGARVTIRVVGGVTVGLGLTGSVRVTVQVRPSCARVGGRIIRVASGLTAWSVVQSQLKGFAYRRVLTVEGQGQR